MTTYVNDIRGTRVIVGLVPALYDEVSISYPSTTETVYIFKLDSVVLGIVTVTADVDGNITNVKRTS